MSTTSERVRAIIAEHLCAEPHDVTPAATLAQLGADSLDLIELEMEIEEKFEVQVDDHTLTGETTVDDMVKLVDSLLA